MWKPRDLKTNHLNESFSSFVLSLGLNRCFVVRCGDGSFRVRCSLFVLIRTLTVLCLISAPGAFELRNESLLLFTAILHKFSKNPQNFLLILCN